VKRISSTKKCLKWLIITLYFHFQCLRPSGFFLSVAPSRDNWLVMIFRK
jgi:hypothetical protein